MTGVIIAISFAGFPDVVQYQIVQAQTGLAVSVVLRPDADPAQEHAVGEALASRLSAAGVLPPPIMTGRSARGWRCSVRGSGARRPAGQPHLTAWRAPESVAWLVSHRLGDLDPAGAGAGLARAEVTRLPAAAVRPDAVSTS